MHENYFNSLITHGQKIDNGIKKLTDIWRYPHNVFGGYGTDVDQAEANITIIRAEIEELKEKIIDDAKLRRNDNVEMDKFLENAQKIYLDLDQSANDIGLVLSEYGYVKLEDESRGDKLGIGADQESSLIASDVTDDLLEVEFTPNMTWRHSQKRAHLSERSLSNYSG